MSEDNLFHLFGSWFSNALNEVVMAVDIQYFLSFTFEFLRFSFFHWFSSETWAGNDETMGRDGENLLN